MHSLKEPKSFQARQALRLYLRHTFREIANGIAREISDEESQK
jgi:hypothetical protein